LLAVARRFDPQLASEKRDRAITHARKYAAGCRWATARKRQPFAGTRRDCHIATINRSQAVRRDDVQPLEGERYRNTSGSGSGAWKQLESRQVCRVVFDKPCKTLSSLASSIPTPPAVSHIRELILMCSLLCLLAENLCITALMCDLLLQHAASFLIVQIMWDETKFRVRPLGELSGRAPEVSFLAIHGRVLWTEPDPDNTQHDEDLICPPAAIAGTAAADLWAGLRLVLPPEIFQMLSGQGNLIGLQTLCLGSDHHGANLKLMAYVENMSPQNLMILKGLCKQHASGLCLQPLLKLLGIPCPAYCVAGLFRQDKFYADFKKGMRLSVARHLKWRKESDEPSWRPNPLHIEHARSILELAYFKRDLRDSATASDAAVGRERESMRRKRGEALLGSCVGNWKTKTIVYWDRVGLPSLEAVVDAVMVLLYTIGFHVLGTPSTNKWLSMWLHLLGDRGLTATQ
jgi:hypothetical protein